MVFEGICWIPWISMGFDGFQSMDFTGIVWIPMGFQYHFHSNAAAFSMRFDGFPWDSMDFDWISVGIEDLSDDTLAFFGI